VCQVLFYVDEIWIPLELGPNILTFKLTSRCISTEPSFKDNYRTVFTLKVVKRK